MGVLTACTPRAEVLKGDLQDAIFAADFGELIAGTALPVYGDAATFFRNTHPATQLRAVVKAVFGRLADPNEPGVPLRLSTGFGGGKTHTLMTLWHLARNIADPSCGTDLLSPANRPKSVHIVAIDGNRVGTTVFAEHENGAVKTHSLAGEVFYQLGGRAALDRLGAADDPEQSPSVEQLDAVLPDGPLLLLFDELVAYQATLSERGKGNLLQFISKLLRKAASRPQTVIVVTDPGTQQVYAGESKRLRDTMDQASGAQPNGLDELFDRVTSEFDPIGREGPQVISRRLFESIDHNQAQTTAAMYHELYTRVHGEHPGLLDPEAAHPDYANEISRCYPFHPRLFRTLRDRLGAIQDFQKSRGMLRLFARIIRDLWEAGADVELITAGDLDWSSPRIQGDLLDRVQRASFRPAVSADIEGHAAELDGGPRGVHRRVASALLLESLPMTPQSGLSEAEVTLATLRPEEAGPEPSEALGRLCRACWHTYPMGDGRGWQFRYEPNVNKQIEERMESVSPGDAERAVSAEVQGYFAGAGLKVCAWPEGPRQVPDTPTFQVVLCESEALARAVCAYVDDNETPRRFRNALVAVAPNAPGLQDAHNRARRLLAAEQIQRESEGESHKVAREQLKGLLPDIRHRFQLQARRAFDRVVTANGAYSMEEKFLVADDPAKLMTSAKDGQKDLRSFLDEKKLTYGPDETLEPDRFVDVILCGATPLAHQPDVTTAKAIHERFLSARDLKLVIDADVTRRAIQWAVREGRIVVRTDNGNAYDAQGCVTGSEGERRRVVEGLPSLTMDDSVLVCRADQSSAKLWLHVDPIAPIGGKPDVGTVLPPPPPPPPPPGPEKDRARIIARAEKEPLVSLRLAARTPADAATLAGLAQPLGANSLTQSVRLSGELRGGGTVGFRAEGLPLGHAANPLEIARTLHRGLTDEADFEAELALHFGDAGRTGLAGPLSCLCDQAPDGIELEAKFGRPEEVEQ